MPPPDRHGLFICTCDDCRKHILHNREQIEPSHGRRVGVNELNNHRRHQMVRDDPPMIEVSQATNTVPNPRLPPTSPIPDESHKECNQSDIDFLQTVQTLLHQKQVSEYYKEATLVFSDPPNIGSSEDSLEPNLTLREDALANLGLNTHAHWLEDIEQKVDGLCFTSNPQQSSLAQALLEDIRSRSQEVQMIKLAEWNNQKKRAELSRGKTIFHTRSIYRFQNYEPVTLTCYLLVAILHFLCGLSLDHCNVVLKTCELLIKLLTPMDPSLSKSLPSDLRTVLDILQLNPSVVRFACCPRCYSLYQIDPGNLTSIPQKCPHAEFPGGEPCNRQLRVFERESSTKKGQKKTGQIWKVTREMLYHDIREWIAELYNRADIEPYLDRQQNPAGNGEDDEIFDIWDSPALRSFQGPDGLPFLDRPGNEGRLVFALNEDGINPYGNLIAGKSVSVGAVYLVCLNLPPALRYKKENMCLVAIIPGPSSPSRHQINHVLAPLVAGLKDLWNEGVYLARTAGYPFGRLVRAAVRVLICDLPAARQVAGLPHFAHTYFCHLCPLAFDDIRNFDFWSWPRRTYRDHQIAAEAWRSAQNSEEKEAIVKQTGFRWSVLMELPYWDSIEFTVIDTMHCFFLRILPHHCREIWGMDVELEDGEPLSSSKWHRLSDSELMHAVNVLKFGSNDDLEKLPMATLRQLCFEAGLPYGGRRRGPHLRSLMNYRSGQGWPLQQPDNGQHASDGFSVDAALHLFNTGTKSAIDTLQKPKLVFMATNIWNDESESVFLAMRRGDIAAIINKKRQELGILDAEFKLRDGPGHRKRSKTSKTAVLGRQTLKEVQKDILDLVVPSWFIKAPAHPGEAKWGKLTAVQWRAMCLTHLPITLIRLWGYQKQDTRHARMLFNFMHLVTAISLATARTMSRSRIEGYERHMHMYLETLLLLYPGTEITPYQHLSLHLGNMLKEYGPTHGWRCYPFERANGELRNISTNNKFGELEQTMLNRFCAAQRLHSLMGASALPPAVHDLLPVFARHFESDIQGKSTDHSALRFDEIFHKVDDPVNWRSEDEVLLPPEIYDQVKVTQNNQRVTQTPHRAYMRPHIKLLGHRFECWTSRSQRDRWSHGNSMVVFQQATSDWAAGQIHAIMQQRGVFSTTVTYFVLDVLKPLLPEHIPLDPYRSFPPLGGQLFYKRFQTNRMVVPLEQVLGHFASTQHTIDVIGVPCIHVIPLL